MKNIKLLKFISIVLFSLTSCAPNTNSWSTLPIDFRIGRYDFYYTIDQGTYKEDFPDAYLEVSNISKEEYDMLNEVDWRYLSKVERSSEKYKVFIYKNNNNVFFKGKFYNCPLTDIFAISNFYRSYSEKWGGCKFYNGIYAPLETYLGNDISIDYTIIIDLKIMDNQLYLTAKYEKDNQGEKIKDNIDMSFVYKS